MDIGEFQRLMREIYGERDRRRGLERSFIWLVEELGELGRALFREDHAEREVEFADVLAWLASVADQAGVDLESAAVRRYVAGCPRCERRPCVCHP